jgi:hypothetical protein
MKRQAGIWIDPKKAFVVFIGEGADDRSPGRCKSSTALSKISLRAHQCEGASFSAAT